MTTRKITGYIFIGIAIILIIAIVGQLAKFVGDLIGIFKIFTAELDSYQVGQITGTFIYWLIHIFLTIFLWNRGKQLTQK